MCSGAAGDVNSKEGQDAVKLRGHAAPGPRSALFPWDYMTAELRGLPHSGELGLHNKKCSRPKHSILRV